MWNMMIWLMRWYIDLSGESLQNSVSWKLASTNTNLPKLMKGNYSHIHFFIAKYGYEAIYKEYKSIQVRTFCQKYHVCNKTIQKIFGPKMSPSKKRMVEIMRQE